MKDIEWLFFDLGSTLIDENEVYRRRFAGIAEVAGMPCEEVLQRAEALYRQNKKGDLELAKMLGAELPAWESEYERLYDDTEKCLQLLSEKYRIGTIANQLPGTAERLKNFGILKYFDVIAASAEEGAAKPDRRIFDIALERAGCPPHKAVMIGDRIDNDIVPAKRLGMKTIWIKRGFGGYWTITDSSQRPDMEINDLTELADIL